MKTRFLTLLLPCITMVAHGQEAKPEFRDAVSHEELVEKRRAMANMNPMASLPADVGEDPTVVNKIGNLLENSDLITYNGLTTLVPKNAIVMIPEKYAAMINKPEPGTQVVSWLDFFSTNRSWISTVEVTFAQAKGDVPVSPEILEHLGKSGNMVVAVLQCGPISVMPPKPVESTLTANQTPQP